MSTYIPGVERGATLTIMPRSNYSMDSGDYVPILVGAPRADPRRRSPESQGNNIFLNIPANARPRAASTSGNAQPINLHITPTEWDNRSRSHHRHHSRHSSSSSDRSRRSRRSSRYEYDNLPYDIRKEIDYAKSSRAEERSRSRERRRDRDRQRWEDDFEDRKKKEQREKDRIIADAKDAEDKRKKEDEKLRQKILDEEEEKKKKKKKEKELEDKIFEEKVREKFRAAGMLLSSSGCCCEGRGMLMFRAGYSDAHIDEVLHRKREKRREGDREWAIDLSRPTFIKVNRKYLSPATLDHFHLPWEWDKVSHHVPLSPLPTFANSYQILTYLPGK